MHYDLISDTETGGLYASRHALLSIGAVCSWNAPHFLVHITPESQPGKTVEPEAAKKNGYTPETWSDLGAVTLAEGFQQFLDYIAARRAEHESVALWCHNLAFDRGFYMEAERITGLEIPHRHGWRCSQSKFGDLMDQGVIPKGSSGLDRLIELSGQSPRDAVHAALEDCHCTLRGLNWLRKKEREEVNTVRQLYTESLKERRRLEALMEGRAA